MNAIFEKLDEFAKSKNFGTPGTLSVALAITHLARENGLPLNPDELLTASGTQVKRLGKDLVQSVLERHQINGVLAAEGGRTSRGSVANMREYVNFLNELATNTHILNLDEVEKFWVQRAHKLILLKQAEPEQVSYSAVPLDQNDQRFLFTTIPVSSLFPYCFVAGRNEDPVAGFQRRLNRGRAEDIAQYLHDGKGSIPTNIVLSAQPDAGIEYNSRTKTLSYQKQAGSFLVLDGQHRLWGYEICREKFKKDLRVPVSIYIGLSRAQEARLFIDINTTQVGVPSALLLDIKQIAEIESSSEQVLRGFFDSLNSDSLSPLHNLLSPAKSVTGKISRVTFNKAMMAVLRSNVWGDISKKHQYQVLVNYLTAIVNLLSDRTLLARSAFFEAICEVFEDVVQTALTKHGNVKEDSIREILKPIQSSDLLSITEKSRPTKSVYLESIKKSLRKNITISDAMV